MNNQILYASIDQNKNLTLHDWCESYETPCLEQRLAAGLVRLTLHGIIEESKEDNNLIKTIGMDFI